MSRSTSAAARATPRTTVDHSGRLCAGGGRLSRGSRDDRGSGRGGSRRRWPTLARSPRGTPPQDLGGLARCRPLRAPHPERAAPSAGTVSGRPRHPAPRALHFHIVAPAASLRPPPAGRLPRRGSMRAAGGWPPALSGRPSPPRVAGPGASPPNPRRRRTARPARPEQGAAPPPAVWRRPSLRPAQPYFGGVRASRWSPQGAPGRRGERSSPPW